MKHIFEILEEEKVRILEMHENATKNQYLNEQLLAQPQVPNPTQNLIGAQGAPKNFQNITPTQKNDTKPSANNQTTYTVRNRELILTGQNKKTTAGAEDLKIFKGAKFIKQGGNIVANTKYQFVDSLGNVIIGVGQNPTMRSIKTYQGNVTYGCSTGKYTVNMRTDLMFYDKTLSPMLNKMCQAKTTETQPTTQTPKTQEPKTQAPKTQAPSGVRVSDLNKQIQQSLGNQKPTGQITDAEIDTILTKLG